MKRPLNAKYPAIDNELLGFVQLSRSEPSPVSTSLMQEQAKLAAERAGITGFKGSVGYVQKFLRQNSVQKSIR